MFCDCLQYVIQMDNCAVQSLFAPVLTWAMGRVHMRMHSRVLVHVRVLVRVRVRLRVRARITNQFLRFY